MYRKIDFRVRPPYGAYLQMFQNEQKHFARLADAYDMTVSRSQKTGELDWLVREMDEANIEISVVPSRKNLNMRDDELMDLEKMYPGRFIVFPYIDPTDDGDIAERIDRYRGEKDVRGFSAEPTFQPKPYAFNDKLAYPMYEKLQKEGIPYFISFSAKLLPVVDSSVVKQIGDIVHDFPDLKLIIGHGGWPWHMEVFAMAFNSPSVYVVPDMYGLSGAGGEDYIRSVNTLMKHQMMFGSAYPILNNIDVAKYYESCGIKESVLPDFFYNTAAELLRL